MDPREQKCPVVDNAVRHLTESTAALTEETGLIQCRNTGEEKTLNSLPPSSMVMFDCQTWAAGSRRLCQSTAVTEGARVTGGAVSQGRPAS